MKEKTQVTDIDRSLYDFRYEEDESDFLEGGITPAIIEEISKEKNDPEWMREFRLKSLEIYNKTPMVNWGASIEGLDVDNIVTYIRPKTRMNKDWDSVPDNIKETFERLGIPQAERESLAGVGAQYDSELVYHNVREEVAKSGVVYTDLESAMHDEKYAQMIKEHFMKLVPPTDHKFAALHGAVWSGGSFVYVPKRLMLHRIHEDSTTHKMFEENKRTVEDLEMFRKFWPAPIARFINKFYTKSEDSNNLEKK